MTEGEGLCEPEVLAGTSSPLPISESFPILALLGFVIECNLKDQSKKVKRMLAF
jgi:hypothetical protein